VECARCCLLFVFVIASVTKPLLLLLFSLFANIDFGKPKEVVVVVEEEVKEVAAVAAAAAVKAERRRKKDIWSLDLCGQKGTPKPCHCWRAVQENHLPSYQSCRSWR